MATVAQHARIAYSQEATNADSQNLVDGSLRLSLEPDDDPIFVDIAAVCPVCSGPFANRSPLKYFRADPGSESLGSLGASQNVHDIVVICSCNKEHKDQPKGSTGCGRSFKFCLEFDDAAIRNTVVTAGRAPTDHEIAATRKLDALAASDLPRVRAVAEKWKNGTAIGGLAAVALGLLSGPGELAELPAGVILWLAITSAVAVITGIATVGLALFASFGWPSRQAVSSAPALAVADHKEAQLAIRALKASGVFSLIATLTIALSIGIATFSPVSDPGVMLEGADGSEHCVTSVLVRASEVAFAENGAAAPIQIPDVKSIKAVKSC